MMVTAIQKEQVRTEKNAAFLTSRPEVDYLERESFFYHIKRCYKARMGRSFKIFSRSRCIFSAFSAI